MKEIRTSGPLMFSDPNCPTRVGEIINTISEIYDIPNPSEGMQVYVRDEKKTYTITGLKEAVIGGERVPDAKVDTFEAVKSQVEEINNDFAEMQKALIDGSFVVGIAKAVKAGAVTFEMLDGKLQLSASVVDDLETDDALKPLSANQGKVLKELIDIINGTGEGSTDKKITDAIAKLVDNAPENLDTLKELAEWIKDHGTEVAEMLAAINANATAIKTEAERATGAESDIKASAISKDGIAVLETSTTLDLGCKTLAGEEFMVEFPPATTKMAGVMSAADKVKLNASIKNVDVSPNTDDVELDLEDNTDRTTHVAFPAATAEKAGVMSAEDKKALDTATSRALRALFVAAGAEYNDTGADKTKTAPWGETVTHKAGHYYLNGLGDITEEQMMEIYNAPHDALREQGYIEQRTIRTAIFKGGTSSMGLTQNVDALFLDCSNIEVVGDRRFFFYFKESNTPVRSMFRNCVKLRVINVRIFYVNNITLDQNCFGNCQSLEYVNIERLHFSLSLADCSRISKNSIVYMIQKAIPTSAITITLHPDAYARLANDADIVAALEAQPLVTLVSA